MTTAVAVYEKAQQRERAKSNNNADNKKIDMKNTHDTACNKRGQHNINKDMNNNCTPVSFLGTKP